MDITVHRAGEADKAAWLALRHALWPHSPLAELAAEIDGMSVGDSEIAFLARDDDGQPIGLAEVSVRHDYVNGCETSPVGFLEGIFVVPDKRRHGVARLLAAAAEGWARQQGCVEFASDAALDNVVSHRMHRALGFAETQRVVFFRKRLG